ncbi:unnamed protein product [Kuraishia capsulata CBS 1993]|uniref:Uncharacterized protein n=1 Tax=Kuraishia capsulata CBS 1993 TaxID=1382522 RepID=W6MKB2_9ASCO|nr:uncharacterized protein KUCA_T00001039001 [Kuraishia capsulata CBS 1993]CDK25072.1 unnamed protein product [Kuraishia capsulata CBS 1993]
MEKIQIPDMRFEQGFRRALTTNALRVNGQTVREKSAGEQHPLPVITPGIVIYTIVKDQLLMPFVQGFAWACILLAMKPWLFRCIQSGRNAGVWIFSSFGLYTKRKVY